MFVFAVDSIIVKSWVSLIQEGKRTKQQVPDLYNLREAVFSRLAETE